MTLKVITNEQYQKLLDSEVIDADYDERIQFKVNKYLKSCMKKSKHYDIIMQDMINAKKQYREEQIDFYMEHPNLLRGHEMPQVEGNIHGVYDHLKSRNVFLNGYNYHIEFSFPYNDVDAFGREACEGWLHKDYVVVLVNPLLYKYKYKTLTVANVEKRTASTDHYELFSKINEVFEKEVGVPLFYLTPYQKSLQIL